MPSEADTYDFGTAPSRGALLRKETWSYWSGILGLVYQDRVYDGSNNLAGETAYEYDGTSAVVSSGIPHHQTPTCPCGNLTSLTQYASSGTSYTSTGTYEDTGSLLTATTPNGTTTYSYNSTFVYNTGVSLPTPYSGVALATGQTYDTTNTGLPLNSTDPNSQVTRITSYDSMLRPTEVQYPDNGETTWAYTPTTIETSTLQAGTTYATRETELDGYGRTSRVKVANGQGANPYYQTDTCYDANSNVYFISYAYPGTGFGGAKVCPLSGTAGDTYTYDVLGRVTQLARANGETVNYTYTGRATKVVDQNGVTRISQIDGLGRPTIVCEIPGSTTLVNSGSPVSCGTDISGTGYVTSYAYTLATPTTTITQGVQTRTFVSDWLGRPTSV